MTWKLGSYQHLGEGDADGKCWSPGVITQNEPGASVPIGRLSRENVGLKVERPKLLIQDLL